MLENWKSQNVMMWKSGVGVSFFLCAYTSESLVGKSRMSWLARVFRGRQPSVDGWTAAKEPQEKKKEGPLLLLMVG